MQRTTYYLLLGQTVGVGFEYMNTSLLVQNLSNKKNDCSFSFEDSKTKVVRVQYVQYMLQVFFYCV